MQQFMGSQRVGHNLATKQQEMIMRPWALGRICDWLEVSCGLPWEVVKCGPSVGRREQKDI